MASTILLGKNTPAAGSSATTIACTTTQAANGKTVAAFGWFGASVTLASVADDSGLGTTWTVEKQQANGSDHFAIASCDTELPSGTTVTGTLSGSGDSRYIQVVSSDTADASAASTDTAGNAATGTGWTSNPVTAANGDFVFGGCYGAGIDATDTPTGGNTEIQDMSISGDSCMTTVWQQGVGDDVAASGTWSASETNSAAAVVFAGNSTIDVEPRIRAQDSYRNGTTSITCTVPSTFQVGDLLLLVLESSNSTTTAGTPATPTGFDKIYEETQGAGATGVTTLTIFARIADGTETTVSVTGVANHVSGTLFVISHHGCSATSDVLVGTGNGANTGNGTALGITTTTDRELVLACVAITRDASNTANFSAWANSNLEAGLTEYEDHTTTSGAGGGIGVAAGVMGTAGATGNSTVTISTSAQWRAVMLGIPHTASAGNSYDLTVAAETDAAQTLTYKEQVTLPVKTETDTAQALSVTEVYDGTIATETDVAQTLTVAKHVTLPIATETDTARTLRAPKLPTASEGDAAQPLTAKKAVTLPVASEADAAQPVTAQKLYDSTIASETDQAQALTVAKHVTLPIATETDTAIDLSVPGATAYTLPVASETDAAQALTAKKKVTAPTATEADAAQPLAVEKLYWLANQAQVYVLTTTSTLNAWLQHVTVTPGESLVFSFYAKRGTASDVKYSVYDWTNGADIVPTTSYYGQLNSADFVRVEVAFTVPAGCTDLSVYLTRDSGAIGTTYVAAAQLETGTTATDWERTEGGTGKNRLKRSEALDTSPWTTFSGTSMAADSTTLSFAPVESDAAQTLTVAKHVTLPIATETDVAVTFTYQQGHGYALPVAAESDSAQTLSVVKVYTLPVAVDTSTAQGLTVTKRATFAPAAELDQAQPLTWHKQVTLPTATDTSTAQPLDVTTLYTIPPAGETDTALALVIIQGKQPIEVTLVAAKSGSLTLTAAAEGSVTVGAMKAGSVGLGAARDGSVSSAAEADASVSLTVELG